MYMGPFTVDMEDEATAYPISPEQSANLRSGDESNLEEQLVKLQLEVLTLQKEKDDLENDFGLKRARFKELFLQKEDASKQNAEHLRKITAERDELINSLEITRSELEETRNIVAALQCTTDGEIGKLKKEHQDEIDNLHRLLNGLHSEDLNRCKSELEILRKRSEIAEAELNEMKGEKENILSQGVLTISNVTKSFAKRVENLSNVGTLRHPDLSVHSNKRSNKYAQEDADFVKSLVPSSLDEEIKSLKEKLREADDKLRRFECSQVIHLPKPDNVDVLLNEKVSSEDLDDKLKELSCGLEAEKSSRADLETYVSILNTQKLVLQQDAERLRSQLKNSEEALEYERRCHNELKNTWQMANNQFLESQQLHSLEVKRLQELLDLDQGKSIAGEPNEPVASPIIEGLIDKLKPRSSIINNTLLSQFSPIKKRKGALHSKSDDKSKSRVTDDHLTFQSNESLLKTDQDQELNISDIADGNRTESEVMNKDLSQLSATSSELECYECNKYRSQIEQLEKDKEELLSSKLDLQKVLNRHKDDISDAYKERKEMTERWSELAKESEKQILELHAAVEKSESQLQTLQNKFIILSKELPLKLESLENDRKRAEFELQRLQEENETLMGNHVKTSNELKEEVINLPTNMEDLHLYVLKLQENLIAAKVGQETFKNKAKSFEIQLQDVMALKESLLSRMKELYDMSESAKNHAGREQIRRLELEKEIVNLKASLDEVNSSLKQQEIAYKKTIDEHLKNQIHHEDEIFQLRTKISGLQKDLDNSEVVQRDFVKLSQSLQVQLESIRQSENEVRWQHEEDVDECLMCKNMFAHSKKKHHCRHCGKIFCQECLSKTVISGPNSRVSRVCEVCHTMLVKDIAPYFSLGSRNTPG